MLGVSDETQRKSTHFISAQELNKLRNKNMKEDIKHYDKGQVGECGGVWRPAVRLREARSEGNADPWTSSGERGGCTPLCSSGNKGEAEQSTSCSSFQKRILLKVEFINQMSPLPSRGETGRGQGLQTSSFKRKERAALTFPYNEQQNILENVFA